MNKQQSVQQLLEGYYHYVLTETKLGRKPLQYLAERGINEQTIKKFKLGFSPFGIKPTLEFLKRHGFNINDLINKSVFMRYQTGKYKGELTDPLNNRIIFPIHNYQGITVGFGGRTISKKNKIKYMNSAETDSFIKGDNLYGFALNKENIENYGYAILFEGYFDCITAYQFHIKNSVATMGTALTYNQALLLRDITQNVVIVFDSDKAGMEASFKSASVLEKVGCNVRIARLPDNLDPDSYLQRFGRNLFVSKVIASAKPLIESFIDYKKQNYDLTNPQERYSFAHEVLNELSLKNKNEVKRILTILGEKLNVSLKMIYDNVNKKVVD